MKIDIFSHVMPKKVLELFHKKNKGNVDLSKCTWLTNRALSDMDVRLRLMERYPEVVDVLTLAIPGLEVVFSPGDAVEAAKMINEEIAELVAKYPNMFLAGVASLPLNDMDATLKEADRAINQLGLRGVQIFSNIDGEPLDSPRLRPLYEKMAQYDLPIWIHPWDTPFEVRAGKNPPEYFREYFKAALMGNINWPIDTSFAMIRLAHSGVFESYPNIKFITHHCGGMIPYYQGRIRNENARKFYADTALWIYGNNEPLMCGYKYFGADHILFGTDAPLGGGGGSLRYGRTYETVHTLEQMDIPEADKDKIFRSNAIRLLKIGV